MSPALRRALELAEGLPSTPANLDRVAAATSPESARAAFLLWDLRRRARIKFALAERMWFDRDGLEMATHERVAAARAHRFPEGAEVWDLTCGIGSDLLALAGRGPARGVDRNADRVAMANWNLAAHGRPETAAVGDALDIAPRAEYAVADPARRTAAGRVPNVDGYAPDPRALVAALQGARLFAIKLSPMLPDADLEGLGTELAFTSFGGECREAVVWGGREAEPGRYAWHVESGERLEAAPAPPETETPDVLVFDVDPAAVRAHAVGRLGLPVLGGPRGYLTGPDPVPGPWLRAYRTLWHGPADPKRTRAALRDLEGGPLTVKARGVRTDAAETARRYAGKGGRSLVLFVYPVGPSVRHLIAEPVAP